MGIKRMGIRKEDEIRAVIFDLDGTLIDTGLLA